MGDAGVLSSNFKKKSGLFIKNNFFTNESIVFDYRENPIITTTEKYLIRNNRVLIVD
jgi:hypothetical protein